jgi:hypothetical protein
MQKYSKCLLAGLCVIALVGFFLPAIQVEMSFLGSARTSNFSLATVFEDSDSPFEGMDFAQSDLADRFGDNDMMADVGSRVALSVAFYLITFVLVLCVLAFTGLGRLPRLTAAVIVCGAVLFFVAGRVILTVPGILLEGLENRMGFLALFIDFSEMLTISLGAGYRLTMIVLGGVALVKGLVLLHTARVKSK